jgi:hypothetical protein
VSDEVCVCEWYDFVVDGDGQEIHIKMMGGVCVYRCVMRYVCFCVQ